MRSTLASVGLILDDEEIVKPHTGLAVQRAVRRSCSVNIAGGVTGDGEGDIRSRRAELARPLLHAAGVVFGDKKIVAPRTGLAVQPL